MVFVLSVFLVAVSCIAQELVKAEFYIDENGPNVNRTFFLIDDGSLRGTGDNEFGQLGIDGEDFIDRADEVIATGVADVSTGNTHTLILKSDGSLWGVGGNDDGQLGLGNYQQAGEFVEIVSSGVISMAAGNGVSYFVKDDGSLWGMGRRALLVPSTENANYASPIVLEGSGVREVHASNKYMVLLNEDGTVYARHISGSPYYFGGVSEATGFRWQLDFDGNGIGRIDAGWDYCLFRDENGGMWGVGDGVFRLGLAPFSDDGASALDDLPFGLTPSGFSAGLDRILYWDSSGDLWSQSYENSSLEPVLSAGTVKRAFAGSGFEIVVGEDGINYGIGSGNNSVFGAPVDSYNEYTELNLLPRPDARTGKNLYAVDTDGSGSALVTLDARGSETVDGEVIYTWTWDGGSASGAVVTQAFPVGATDVGLIVEDVYGFVDTDEMIVEVMDQSVLTDQVGNPAITKMAAWSNSGFIVRSDGSLWAIGRNYYGILGDGTAIDQSAFIEVLPYGVQDVTNGGTLLMKDGSVRRLQGNDDPGNPYRLDTVIESGAVAISGTDTHTQVLLNTGAVLAWGDNWAGSVGDGTKEPRLNPVEVIASGCVGLGTSTFSSIFYMEDGSVWGCGYLGDRLEFLEPTKLFDAGFSQVETDLNGAFLISNDGALYRTAWEVAANGSVHQYAMVEVDPLGDGSRYQAVDYSPNMIWLLTESGRLLTRVSYENDGFENEGDLAESNGYQEIFTSEVVAVSTFQWISLILKEDNSLWVMGELDNAGINIDEFSSVENIDTVQLALEPALFFPEGPYELVPSPERQTEANAGKGIAAVFTGDQATFPVLLDGSGSWDFNGIESWKWTWNGVELSGEFAEIQLPVGTHEIFLEIENRFGTKSTDSISVYVVAKEEVRSWLSQYYSDDEINAMGDVFYGLDSDSDGIPTVVEMMYGLDPSNVNSRLRATYEIVDGQHSIRVPYWGGDDMRVWTSFDLVDWYEYYSTFENQGGQEAKIQVSNEYDRFYRVNIDLPEVQGN